MAITRACYCSREAGQRSVDFNDGVDQNAAADRAIETASKNIDAHLNRRFYPVDATRYFDWPSQGGSGGGWYAYPWRLWLDQNDLVVLTSLTSGGTVVPLNQVFAEPVNDGPPFTYIELDRGSSATFTGGALTPQHSIAMAGTWGHGAAADPAGSLAASAGTSDTTITVSDGSQAGVGDLLILGYGRGAVPFPSALGYAGAIAPYTGERVLVTDRAAADTTLAQSGAGCSTASAADNALTTTGAGTLHTGEVIILDQERMLVEQIAGGVATVRRAWDGTVLTTHTAAEVYAPRLLSVTRAMYGTTAASYSGSAAIYRHRVPGLIRDLAIAEMVNQVLQEGSGYARTVGSGDAAMPAPGADLASKWDEAMTAYGRKARMRVV